MTRVLQWLQGMISDMRITEHREAKGVLANIQANKSKYCTIHYSCQGFYENDTGLLPRITSIAINDLSTWQAQSFSIHISAALMRIPLEDIPGKYDIIEAAMLKDYFEYLKANEKMTFVHWNMRNGNYGFSAIEQRGQLLCPGDVYKLPNERKIDLSRLFIQLYGKCYISHPQLKSLIEKNYTLPINFMEGKNEAEAFDSGQYVKLHQSTSVKAASLSKLIDLAADGELKTNASWRDMYGISVDGIITHLGNRWYGRLLFGLSWAVIGAFLGILGSRIRN